MKRHRRERHGARRATPRVDGVAAAVDWALLIGALRRHREPIVLHDLARMLGTEDVTTLGGQLSLLDRAGAARLARGGRWSLHSRVRLAVGRLVQPRPHFGFVTPEDGPGPDIFLAARRMREASHGDRVLVRLIDSARSREGVEGEVLAVLEARSRIVAGVFRGDGRGGGFVEPCDPRSDPVWIDRRDRADDGDIVVAESSRSGGERTGRIVETLGPIEDPSVEQRLVARTYGLPGEFPDDVQREAEEGPREIAEKERATREDFTGQGAVTIDPADAKDHDDAVHAEMLAGGRTGYRLSVHIADVAWSVPAGSAIDAEALRRGVSVYLPGRHIPMLPPELSSDRCSLLPGKDRRTQSVIMEFDFSGAMTASRIVDGIVRSDARLNYDHAQELLDAGSQTPHARMLRVLGSLAAVLRKNRMKSGALDLDIPETRVALDAEGHPVDVHPAPTYRSHQMIEEAMLAANGVVAESMERLGHGIFRIHEDPDPAEIEAVEEALHSSGCAPPRGQGRAAGRLRALREHYRGRPEEPMVAIMILRALKLARYSSQPGRHFGLAARVYTHFTSPIRRYPDLVVHRIVRAARRGSGTGDDLWRVAFQSSLLERRAEAAERMMVGIKCALWMKPRIGMECHGMVIGLSPPIVRLEESGIEGLVQDAAAPRGADRTRPRRGARTASGRAGARGPRLVPGETVRVRVAGVDIPRGKVFFRTLATG